MLAGPALDGRVGTGFCRAGARGLEDLRGWHHVTSDGCSTHTLQFWRSKDLKRPKVQDMAEQRTNRFMLLWRWFQSQCGDISRLVLYCTWHPPCLAEMLGLVGKTRPCVLSLIQHERVRQRLGQSTKYDFQIYPGVSGQWHQHCQWPVYISFQKTAQHT